MDHQPDDVQRGTSSGSEADDVPPPAARRPWRPRPLDVVLVVLVLWLLVCGATLRRARSEAGKGIDAVHRAEELVSPADLVRGRALRPLAEAAESFAKAGRALDSPVVAPLRALPILGRQVRSASALTRAATDVTVVGSRAVREARTALEGPRSSGPERVVLLRRLAAAARRAERALDAVELGPGRALVGPLADRRAELADRLGSVREAMTKGSVVTSGLADLFAGPRRYLVLGANNAEMRAGSGMFLSVGELTFADGEMELGEFQPSGDLMVDPAIAPPIEDADFKARWGWLNPNIEWRNLAASPRFAASAALAAKMWEARGGAPVDGVLMLDPVALQALLAATGPVSVADRTVSETDVLGLVLHDQYAGIENLDDSAQAGRRELLGLIAQSTIGALQRDDADPGALGTALSSAAGQRHILAWASDRAGQRVWAAAGVTGGLQARSLLLSVLNRAGNKLDPFLDVKARLVIRPSRTGNLGELRVVLRNTTPEGESGYVAGIDPASGVGRGDYLGLLSVNLPGFVNEVKVDGAPALAAAGPDGPTTVVALAVRVNRGEAVTQVIRFRLPAGRGSLVVEPTARVPAVGWEAQDESWDSGERREVTW